MKPFGRAELLARIGAVMRRADRSIGAGSATGATGGSGSLAAGNLTIDAGRH